MQEQSVLDLVFNSTIKTIVLILLSLCFLNSVFSQATFNVNAIADLEYSQAGSNSHYYYNEIDQDHVDPRFGISQLNLIGKINFSKSWSINGRILLERDRGQGLEKLVIPQLNLQWHSEKRKFAWTIGNFINPFGAYNKTQLSINRNFIGLPLAYSYYNNISDKLGFVDGLGDIVKIPVDGEVQWGMTNLYYGGYATGVLFSWNLKPSKIKWNLALISGASNLQLRITDPIHYGIVTRLQLQPTYFWEQGFSISHGTFMQESDIGQNLDNLRAFNQTVIGMDYKLGFGYFELSGEIIASFYNAPRYNEVEEIFERGDNDYKQNFSNLAAYLDLKYEMPFIQGSFIAYRIDNLNFSTSESTSDQKWDNNVLRHAMGIGYHINRYLLARIYLSTQQVDNKSWDRTQRTFRIVLTAHY